MKTFNDLKFEPHYLDGNGIQAKINFKNGYGVSVVQCKLNGRFSSYTNNKNEYELAVIKDGSLCYTTPITNDVLGHLSKDEVTKIMKAVQELK